MASKLIKRKQIDMSIFNAPDGQYGCDLNAVGLVPGESIESALDKIACLLDKFAPAPPPNFSEAPHTFYVNSVSHTGSTPENGAGFGSGTVKITTTTTNQPTGKIINSDTTNNIEWRTSPHGGSGNMSGWGDASNGTVTFKSIGPLSGQPSPFNFQSITEMEEIASREMQPWADGAGDDTLLSPYISAESRNILNITQDQDFYIAPPAEESEVGFFYSFKADGKFDHAEFIADAITPITSLNAEGAPITLGKTRAGNINELDGRLLGTPNFTAHNDTGYEYTQEALDYGLITQQQVDSRGLGVTGSLNYWELYHAELKHSQTGAPLLTKYMLDLNNYNNAHDAVFKFGRDDSFTMNPVETVSTYTVGPTEAPATSDNNSNVFTNTGFTKVLNGVPSMKSGMNMQYQVKYDAVNIVTFFYRSNQITFSMTPKDAAQAYFSLNIDGNGVPQPTGQSGNPQASTTEGFSAEHNKETLNNDRTLEINTSASPYFYGSFKFNGSATNWRFGTDSDAFAEDDIDRDVGQLAGGGSFVSANEIYYYWDHDSDSQKRVQIGLPKATVAWHGGDVLGPAGTVGRPSNSTHFPVFAGAAIDYTPNSLSTSAEMQRTNNYWVWPKVDYKKVNDTGAYSGITPTIAPANLMPDYSGLALDDYRVIAIKRSWDMRSLGLSVPGFNSNIYPYSHATWTSPGMTHPPYKAYISFTSDGTNVSYTGAGGDIEGEWFDMTTTGTDMSIRGIVNSGTPAEGYYAYGGSLENVDTVWFLLVYTDNGAYIPNAELANINITHHTGSGSLPIPN